MYLDFFEAFVTIETPLKINIWSMKPEVSISERNIGSYVQNSENFRFAHIYDIESLNLLLVISTVNEMLLFDYKKNFIMLRKTIKLNSLISVLYSTIYNAIIFIDEDYTIMVLKLKKQENAYEISFVGRLVGHLAIIKSGCLIEPSDILVTIDENSVIKFWSLDTMTYIRSVSMTALVQVRSIIYIKSIQSIAIVSKKINIYKLIKNKVESENVSENIILKVKFDGLRNRILIFRSKDYLTICSETGRIVHTFHYKNSESENQMKEEFAISCVCLVKKSSEFYLGETSGLIRCFNPFLKMKNHLLNHSSPITHIFFDKKHQIYITLSHFDIIVQYDKIDSVKNDTFLLRSLKGLFHYIDSVKVAEFCPEMNLILVSTGNNEVVIIDYEFCKVYGVIRFDQKAHVKSITCYYEYGLIIVLLSTNEMKILEFVFDKYVSTLKCSIKLVDNILISGAMVTRGKIVSKDKRVNKYQNKRYAMTNEGGEVLVFAFNIQMEQITKKPTYFEKPSFNYRRKCISSFENEIKSAKIFSVETESNSDRKKSVFQHSLIKFDISNNHLMEIFSIFKAHSGKIHDISEFHQTESLLVSFAPKQEIKIHTFKGELVGHLDLNLPLPKFWKFEYDREYQYNSIYKQLYEMNSNIEQENVLEEQITDKAIFLTQKPTEVNKNFKKSTLIMPMNEAKINGNAIRTEDIKKHEGCTQDFSGLQRVKARLDFENNMKNDIITFANDFSSKTPIQPSTDFDNKRQTTKSFNKNKIPSVLAPKMSSGNFRINHKKNDDTSKIRDFLFNPNAFREQEYIQFLKPELAKKTKLRRKGIFYDPCASKKFPADLLTQARRSVSQINQYLSPQVEINAAIEEESCEDIIENKENTLADEISTSMGQIRKKKKTVNTFLNTLNKIKKKSECNHLK